jgi:hypothetical protein
MIDTPESPGYHVVVPPPPVSSLSSSAGVAQLVEQRFRKPQVVGSIPIAGSRFHSLPLRLFSSPRCTEIAEREARMKGTMQDEVKKV